MAESRTERKVTVILAIDVVGYSVKMEENEEQTLKNLKVCRAIVEGSRIIMEGFLTLLEILCLLSSRALSRR